MYIDSKTAKDKRKRKSKKPIDKNYYTWYNKNMERGKQKNLKKVFRKRKKGIDKKSYSWYNEYRN